MKRKFYTMLMLMVLAFATQAQHFSDKIKFADFEKWASTQKPGSLVFSDCEHEGDAEYNEDVVYRANYGSKGNGLSISLGDLGEFSSYKMYGKSKGEEPFTHNGHEMVYVPMEAKYSSAMLCIKVPKAHCSVTLMAMPLISKEEMKKLVDKIKFNDLIGAGEAAVAWPTEIPEKARLNCTLIKIEKQNASTDGVAYEYHVFAQMGQELIDAIKKVTSTYGGSMESTHIDGKFIFMCAEAQDIESLKQYKRNGKPVEFIYYKNE